MKHAIIAFGLAALLAPEIATAEDWAREAGGWDVGRSGDTCVMTMQFEGEGSTRLALLIQDNTSETFLTVHNLHWSAREDETYELAYHLNGWVYTLPSIGVKADYVRGGFLTMVSKEFLADFAKSDDLEITRDTKLVDDLSLDGSAAGLAVLERCRAELAADLERERKKREAFAHIPVDPFAADTPAGAE